MALALEIFGNKKKFQSEMNGKEVMIIGEGFEALRQWKDNQ